MKVIFFSMLIMLFTSGIALASDERAQTCLSPESLITNSEQTSDKRIAQQVMCCCRTLLSPMCCNFQTSCLGLVKGCICELENKPSLDFQLNESSSIRS